MEVGPSNDRGRDESGVGRESGAAYRYRLCAVNLIAASDKRRQRGDIIAVGGATKVNRSGAFVAGMLTSGGLAWLLHYDHGHVIAIAMGVWAAILIWSDARSTDRLNTARSDLIASNIYTRLSRIEERVGLDSGAKRVE